MADSKISELITSTTPLSGAELLPVVQGGVTKKVAVSDLTTSRDVSTNKLTATEVAVDNLNINGNTVTPTNTNGDLVVDLGSGTGSIEIDRSPSSVGAWAAVDIFDTLPSNTGSNGAEIRYRNQYYGTCAAIQFVKAGNGNNLGYIEFKAAASTTANTLFRMDGYGNLNMNFAGGGNIQVASGKGIDFSANGNAAGMTSELLDDYEEGTFTPSIVSGGGAVSTILATGSYTKIGNLVTFNLYSTFSIGTATGALSLGLGALPTQKTGTNASNMAVVYSRGFIFPANTVALYAYKYSTNVNALLRWQYNTGASGGSVDAGSLTGVYGNMEIMVSGSYLTD